MNYDFGNLKVTVEYNPIDQELWLFIDDFVIYRRGFHLEEDNDTAEIMLCLFRDGKLTTKQMAEILSSGTEITKKLRKAFHPIPWKNAKLFFKIQPNGDVVLIPSLAFSEFLQSDETINIIRRPKGRKNKFAKEKPIYEVQYVFAEQANGCFELETYIEEDSLENKKVTLFMDFYEKTNTKHRSLIYGLKADSVSVTRLSPIPSDDVLEIVDSESKSA